MSVQNVPICTLKEAGKHFVGIEVDAKIYALSIDAQ